MVLAGLAAASAVVLAGLAAVTVAFFERLLAGAEVPYKCLPLSVCVFSALEEPKSKLISDFG